MQANDQCWVELLVSDRNTWNYLTMCKQNYECQIAILETIYLCVNKSALAHLKILSTNYSFTNHIYLMYLYKQDLALNNLQVSICHKTQLMNQPKTTEAACSVRKWK